jgi:predicted regulator of Ras-like GTPase activity (Roadblock/LC7/MglB family)/DNA-binding response OmpR family regulator
MKNVLLVDDDDKFLHSLVLGFDDYKDMFKILTAGNGKLAVEILNSIEVDLLVTDLKMPVMDGFELLAHMASNFPAVPIIVMSAFCTPVIEDKLQEIGIMGIMEKPFDLDRMAETIIKTLKATSEQGTVTGISLDGFVQFVEMEQKTCLLQISTQGKNRKAFLYFHEGELHDAVYGDINGEEAAIEIISWDNAEIKLRNLPEKKIRKRINSALTALLMKAMQRKDEFLEKEREREIEREKEKEREREIEREKEREREREREIEIERKKEKEVENRDLRISQRSSTDILQEIHEIAGVSAVVLVARDGFIIESDGTLGDIDMDMVGASVNIVLNGAERVRQELDLEEFRGMTLESHDAMIMCTPVGEALLVVLAPDSKKLGMIRLRLKNQIPELKKMF